MGSLDEGSRTTDTPDEVTVVVPAPEPCHCGHSRFLHYVVRSDYANLACVCTCPEFTPK